MLASRKIGILDFLRPAIGQGTTLNTLAISSALENRLAEKWIERNRAKGPFFSFIHGSVHWPYNPPEPFLSRFLDPSLKEHVRSIRRDVYELMSRGDLEQNLAVLKSLYEGQIAFVDSCIGNLMDFLKSLDLFENTITIITADHGDLLGEHGLLLHEFVLYEPLIKVPLIIKFPDVFQNGRKYAGLVQTLDIFPTLIDHLGIQWADVAREVQGKSLLRLIAGDDQREFAISERSDWAGGAGAEKMIQLEKEYPGYDWRKYAHEIVALRTDRDKYIWSSEGRHELYDLKQDPQESTNLISMDKGKATELRIKMETWRNSFTNTQPAGPPGTEEMDSSVKKRLRALGYI
jgi:arylsulfatase A-like enzyme